MSYRIHLANDHSYAKVEASDQTKFICHDHSYAKVSDQKYTTLTGGAGESVGTQFLVRLASARKGMAKLRAKESHANRVQRLAAERMEKVRVRANECHTRRAWKLAAARNAMGRLRAARNQQLHVSPAQESKIHHDLPGESCLRNQSYHSGVALPESVLDVANTVQQAPRKRMYHATFIANTDDTFPNQPDIHASGMSREKSAAKKCKNWAADITENAASAFPEHLNKPGTSQQTLTANADDSFLEHLNLASASREQAVEKESDNHEAYAYNTDDMLPEPLNLPEPSRKKATYRKRTYRAAICENVDDKLPEHYCGEMNVLCNFCRSKNFPKEKPHDGKFSKCCHKGKVRLEPLRPVPEYLKGLLTGNDDDSKHFRENIRAYNSSLAFASLGAQIAPPPGYGPYCFRIHGQIYHRTSAAHADGGQVPKYAQLYVLNSEEAINHRVDYNSQCCPHIMEKLDEMMRVHNPYAEAYKMMHEVEQEEDMNAQAEGREISPVNMFIIQDQQDDQRRYNAPRCNEVAIIFRNCDGEPPFHWDIRVHSRNQPLQNISILDPNCDPMSYPLFFPCGGQGWKIGRVAQFDNVADTVGLLARGRMAQAQNPNDKRGITHLQFYAYRLADRRNEQDDDDEFNVVLSGGALTQQYIVDAYCKIEGNRLEYIRQNQAQLRAECYSGLVDHLNNAAVNEGIRPGHVVILPSSFQGSPRNMYQNYHDAMAVVRKFGKPELFITFTCNPKWKEVTENLKPNQKPQDRPDIIARVFHLKLKELMHDIWVKHVFGLPVAYVQVIEFQKRGLPHAHILLILKECDKIRNNETIDKIICAEIPDKDTSPRLYETVQRTMVHGPCGKEYNRRSPCLDDNGVCTKGYPKEFRETTNGDVNGFAEYRRRKDGRTMVVGKHVIDNRFIVPYNKVSTLKYNAHINVEDCASIKSVKYLYKYVYKGHDCANVVVRQGPDEVMNRDEPGAHIDARYVTAPEASWRLLEFPMHDKSHAIIRLAVHLQDEQLVYFHEGQEVAAANRAERLPTTLTDWFELNKRDPSANQYLYPDIPNYYVFDPKQHCWKKRSRGHDKVIGRMYSVSPLETERYHLRLLLLNVEGAKSYADLRSVDGVVCPTFKEACRLRNLLADDSEWDNCLSEAEIFQMPRQLRQLFATICVFCQPSNATILWEKHREFLIEDYLRTNSAEISEQKALRDVEDFLTLHRLQCRDFGLPEPPPLEPELSDNGMFDREAEREEGLATLAMLNAEQRAVFDKIMPAVIDDQHQQRCFFVEGPGGSGKTFLYNSLMSTVRGMGETVVVVASTGIAAMLLKGGRTAHSQFKLPIPLDERSVCKVKGKSKDADQIRKAKLIIWDEVTMAPSHALRATDLLLKELMNDPRPFGGKVILLGGDFRQCLPVVKHSHRVAIVGTTIKNSDVWANFEQLTLRVNMRTLPEEKTFAEWLLKLGNGDLKNSLDLGDDIIPLPQTSVVEDSLIGHVFGDRITPEQVHEMSTRAILCPKNEDSLKLNEKIIKGMAGESVTYKSVDSVQSDDPQEIENFPVEFLNSITPSGMPKHQLILKEGAIIMLLRNINVRKGLCNGTRMVVRKLLTNVIDAEILTGSFQGDRVFIPRIELAPSDTDLPFILRRRQYPVRVSFAMTINKAQGQTFEKVGIYLPSPVFTHGQLYFAFSRARPQNNVKVEVVPSERQGKLSKKVDDTFTVNVVFKEVLT